MKYPHIITSTALAIALVTTAGHAGKDKHKDEMHDSITGKMKRVTQESLDQQFTAQDLIGKSIYDSQGEKIGSVTDFSLPSHASFQKMQNSQQHSDKSQKDDWTQHLPSLGEETTVFISVGGLLGVGDDIVAVPASAISFDSLEERFTLPTSKEQVVALAEQEPYDENLADNSEYSDSRYSAKQSFDSDIDAIRQAFNQSQSEDNELANLSLETDGDKLILSGQVSSATTKRRAESIAREHTDMSIENSIRVSDKKSGQY
ncbi:PRC-barrel domain-containing protein [Pelagicoccus sp. SDUM812003]|uniref:PRC-barrel domain-containing protein n=1 Tax=Pelagicoccus sp. SDUM812003 TaxID=3041267 RepID=UPI00280D7C6B|nr:PRC-barrel domain-containing protein [Pelagicoccus sp. SDUM812003]MDQ8204017.1 PRC-barrel domain-containing protein [Pelagicoccus sp. SDUM812003]